MCLHSFWVVSVTCGGLSDAAAWVKLTSLWQFRKSSILTTRQFLCLRNCGCGRVSQFSLFSGSLTCYCSLVRWSGNCEGVLEYLGFSSFPSPSQDERTALWIHTAYFSAVCATRVKQMPPNADDHFSTPHAFQIFKLLKMLMMSLIFQIFSSVRPTSESFCFGSCLFFCFLWLGKQRG